MFTSSASVLAAGTGEATDTVVTVAERADPIRCAKGVRVVPDHTLGDHPPLDVLLVPGGKGTRHQVDNARYVVDGNLVTSQGIAAGIDMALWLIGRVHGRPHARFVRRRIQYEPAPPYLADEPLTW